MDLSRVAVSCIAMQMSLAIACAARAADFVVTVPSDTPSDAVLYLAGSHPALGNWKPAGLKLVRGEEGTYIASVDLPARVAIEFKITRGNWETVEIAANGQDRPNRRLLIEPSGGPIHLTVERWADTRQAAAPPSVVGTLEIHRIDSDALKARRDIRVWLPADYHDHPDRRYAVLYQFDGQNCFDRATSAFGNEWKIDETITDLRERDRIQPLIVVGIDNGGANRIDEYTFTADPVHGGGKGDSSARFLLNDVIPFVETHYRVRSQRRDRLLGGSSLGGLVSLEIARRHPDRFGGVIAMSPSLWWDASALLNELERDASALRDTRLWIDVGTREGDEAGATRNVQLIQRLDAILTGKTIDHRLVIAKDAEHNEQAWAERFPDAILYLLPKGTD